MPSTKPRVSFVLTTEELEMIKDYQYEHRMKNQTQAILKLIELGLESLSDEDVPAVPEPILSDEEMEVIEKYRLLNREGQIRAQERIDSLIDQGLTTNKKIQAG